MAVVAALVMARAVLATAAAALAAAAVALAMNRFQLLKFGAKPTVVVLMAVLLGLAVGSASVLDQLCTLVATLALLTAKTDIGFCLLLCRGLVD